jgi:hypothetical protein
MTQTVNDNLVLIAGPSSTGKSAALRALRDPEGVMYLNCESGKKLPFPNKFAKFIITDPYQVIEAFNHLEDSGYTITHPQLGKEVKIHTVVVDSLTFLLDMFESIYIFNAADGQKAWGAFQQFFKDLMQSKVAAAKCNVIFTAHTITDVNKSEMVLETKVPVKGALKNNGIEAYFSCVVATKKVPLKELEKYGSDLLDISEEDRMLGFKYVFQTKLTKDTTHERIRSPMGMFANAETFMDNDVQKLIDHLHHYYQ